MTLGQLRDLLQTYQQTWYVRKFILGDHNEAIELEKMLNEHIHEINEYELDDNEIYQLLTIFPDSSNLDLTSSIRSLIGHRFCKIYYTLNSAGLVNAYNFSDFYNLSKNAHSLFYNLFCSVTEARIPLNTIIFEFLLEISINCEEFYFNGLMIDLLRYLNKYQLVNSVTLDFIKIKQDQLHDLYNLCSQLSKSNCLNNNCLSLLTYTKTHIFIIVDCLALLNKAGINIDIETIYTLSSNVAVNKINSILSYIHNSSCILTTQMLEHIFNKDYQFYMYKEETIKILHENKLLTDKSLNYVLLNDSLYVTRILSILIDNDLLGQNHVLIDEIINNELNCHVLYSGLTNFNKIKMLDQNLVELCCKTAKASKNRKSFERNALDIINLFEEFKPSKENLEAVFSLSQNNINRLYSLTLSLKSAKLLNNESFELALQRITEKIFTPTESHIQKISKKNTYCPRSEIIIDHKIHLFTNQRKEYNTGGYGVVKKGFNSLHQTEPSYGIKKLFRTGREATREAAREVIYHKLLDRQAYYYHHKSHPTIVFEWQTLKELHEHDASELLNTSIETRIKCLNSGLADINKLHSRYRVHKDIKSRNFILDLNKATMKLIDFGGAHKYGSNKFFTYTPRYKDPYHSDEFHNDLYAMGLVTMDLFPNIYTVLFKDGNINITLNKDKLSIAEQAIVNLVSSLMNKDTSKRCTSEDALNYTTQVIRNFSTLNATTLENIANTTIARSNVTVEDVMRNARR